MKNDERERNADLSKKKVEFDLSRRRLLQGVLAAGSMVGMSAVAPVLAFAPQRGAAGGARSSAPDIGLKLAQILNKTKYSDLPPKAIEHAKIIIASTLASAAYGFNMDSGRIIREVAKDHAGKPESTIWFDGTKIPVNEATHVNALTSDAAASDDSDMRNTAHIGTCLASSGLAMAERTGASGQDLIAAMVAGYEATGRIGEIRPSTGVHTSQTVAFSGVVACGKLLKLTDEQIKEAMGIAAVTMGGISVGTNSWAREYMGGNAAFCAVNSVLAAARGYKVNPDILAGPGGFVTVYGGGDKADLERFVRPAGPDWDITKSFAVKLVPGAHPNSSILEAAINASKQANVPADQVAKILVAGSRGGRSFDSATLRPPKDWVQAIHSLPYFIACAVADKDFSWVHVTPAKLQSPAAARLITLIENDPAPPPVKFVWGWGGTVTIVTKSGARFTSSVDAPRGSAARGIEWSDIDTKYRALVPESKLASKRIEDSLSVIHRFEQVKNVSELTNLLKMGV